MAIRTLGRFVYDSATAQAVTAGNNIVFSEGTASNGCVANAGQGVLRIEQPGLYNVLFNATIVGTAASAVKVQMLHNGVAVPGASATVGIAAVGNTDSISIASPITVRCCANDTVTFTVDTDTSFTVASAVIERVA